MEQGFTQNTPLMVLGFWLVGCFFFSKLSGWSQLAIHYRLQGRFKGRRFPMQSVRMRWMMNYGNCVTLGANDTGLYMAMLILFRPFHPPLLIPWDELSITSTVNPFGQRFLSLQPKSVPGTSLSVSGALARHLCKRDPEDIEDKGEGTDLMQPEPESAYRPFPTSAPTETPQQVELPPSVVETVGQSDRRRKAEIAAHLDRVLQPQRNGFSLLRTRKSPHFTGLCEMGALIVLGTSA